jgi:hypothetical protein
MPECRSNCVCHAGKASSIESFLSIDTLYVSPIVDVAPTLTRLLNFLLIWHRRTLQYEWLYEQLSMLGR